MILKGDVTEISPLTGKIALALLISAAYHEFHAIHGRALELSSGLEPIVILH